MAKNKPKAPKHRSLSVSATQRLIWQQLRDGNDRTVAILGAGIIEHELARAIMARLRLLSPSDHNRLFDGFGALSSFSQKIEIGYALRIYGKAERKELEAIKAIRNQFAHSLQTKTFSHPKIRKECRALLGHNYSRYLSLIMKQSDTRAPTKTLRQMFNYSIVMMYVILTSEAEKIKRPKAVSPLSMDMPYFRTWLETGALPEIQVIQSRGGKSKPRPPPPRSSQG